MRHRVLWICASALVFALPVVIGAQEEFALDEGQVKMLKAEAAEKYAEGLSALDRVDFLKALGCFAKAAELDNEHIEIRFLVAKLAMAESRKTMEDEALGFLRQAEAAYTEILTMGLTGERKPRQADIERAKDGLRQVQARIMDQDKRDAQRYKVGKDIVTDFIRRVYTAPTPKPAAPKPPVGASASRPAPRAPAAARSSAPPDM